MFNVETKYLDEIKVFSFGGPITYTTNNAQEKFNDLKDQYNSLVFDQKAKNISIRVKSQNVSKNNKTIDKIFSSIEDFEGFLESHHLIEKNHATCCVIS